MSFLQVSFPVRIPGREQDAEAPTKGILGLAEAPAAVAALRDRDDGKCAKGQLDGLVSPERHLDGFKEKIDPPVSLSPRETALHECQSQIVFESTRSHALPQMLISSARTCQQ